LPAGKLMLPAGRHPGNNSDKTRKILIFALFIGLL
jgi:hypothetical protein